MTAVLAVDLGKTGCRATIWTGHADEPRLVREVPGAPGLAVPDGVTSAAVAVVAAAASLLEDAEIGRLDAVCVGAAGAAAAPDAARALADRLLDRLPTDEVAVTSDAITAHAGALGAGTGVVLAAGTGAVAVGVGDGGVLARVDGWGPWLGDEGSGAWIGLAGLRAALRAFDGRGADTALHQAAIDMFGELGRLPLVLTEENNPARTAASFAPVVGRTAAAGDRVAAEIMGAAAAALGEAVIAAARQIGASGPVPVAITGGLAGVGGPLLDPLRAVIAESGLSLTLQAPLGDPLDGARRLALSSDLPHESFITRIRHHTTIPAAPPR
ncbi:N-acetylglucosamine kinase [Streptomyces sp. NPDC059582]|uniref:N-acetylglucosamine kinase n=1 Tax=Streptomyces sp. NPDC059582 TaxID=3346875 RepID=UPI003674A409